MTKHVKYGGSTAARTIACPEWHNLSDGIPPEPASEPAKLGTALHAIIEDCMIDVEKDPVEYVDKVIEGVKIDYPMITAKIDPALDAFEDLMDEYSIDRYWPEVYAEIDEEIGGTADFVGLSEDGKVLIVADYKSGDGVMVDAEENAQGLFYAMCLQNFLIEKKLFSGIEKVVIAIVQPTERREQVLDVWETDLDRVNDFAHKHADAVKVSKKKTQPCTGTHCRFCPAEALCPAKRQIADKARTLEVDKLTLKQLSEALNMVDSLEGFIKAVRKKAQEQLEIGQPIEGWKLVNKRAMRKWTEPEKVIDLLKRKRKIKYDEAVTHKLNSPAQVEKLCKSHGVDYAKEFAPFVACESSGATLAHESDKRPAIELDEVAKEIAARFA